MSEQFTLPTPQVTVQEEEDAFLEKIGEFTKGEPMTEEQAREANNIRMYLAEQFLKPDKEIDVIVLGLNDDFMCAKLKIYSSYDENPFNALLHSLHNVTSIPLDIIPFYKLFKITLNAGEDQPLVNILPNDNNQPSDDSIIPDYIILTHPQLDEFKCVSDNANALNWYRNLQ